jgi:two-component system cell cycle sensor histidine kinase/response regulator CckA
MTATLAVIGVLVIVSFRYFVFRIGGVLQLTVPSYALRLVRRYGAERVGWFVVIAFASLALLHLVAPLNPTEGVKSWDAMPHLACAVGAVLLLIGMGHIETVVSERERMRGYERALRSRAAAKSEAVVPELAEINARLLAELAQRDQVEKALRESEAQYRLVFTENPQPMWIFDVRTSRFLAVNNAALRQYGFTSEEFSALTVRDLLPGTAVGRFLQYVADCCSGAEAHGYWQHYRKDGTLIDLEITATDITYAGAPARLVRAEDITRRRRRELESRQTERMALIGRMAGGVAEHFDRWLSDIQGHTSTLLKPTQTPAAVEQLNQITSATTRATALARRLLLAGGRYPARLEPLDLNGLVRGQLHTLRRLLGDRITVEHQCRSFLSPAMVDRHLVESILVNLVLNAREAMPEGGNLIISTVTLRLDESQTQGNVEARAGEFVRLAVSDNGCGMTPEVQAHLFEPFATAQAGGQGMGMGLAVVSGAVRQMSGWIEYSTEVGVGSEFRVYLPPAPPAEVLAQLQKEAATPVNPRTVLLVEPDERIRGLARCVLNWNDYKVIEAEDAATALLVWQSEAGNVDLLLTDARSAGDISGQELADRLRCSKPGLKIVFTGDSKPETPTPGRAATPLAIHLLKPYSPEKLLQAVQKCLAGD